MQCGHVGVHQARTQQVRESLVELRVVQES
jgi:hypothetical protein